MALKTPLAHARGLGSAKSGVQHWWRQRLTAIALLPLPFWLIAFFGKLLHAPYAEFAVWLQHPGNRLALAFWWLAACYHALLGVQVVVEDYVHRPARKWAALIALPLLASGLALAGLLCILHVTGGYT